MFRRFYELVNGRIGDVFAKYGQFATRNPWKLIILSVMTNILLGIGLVRINIQSDTEFLFTPHNSQAFLERARVRTIFPDKSEDDFYLQNVADFGHYGEIIVRSTSGDVLESEVLTEILAIYTYVNEISIEYHDQKMMYDDICGRRHLQCVVEGADFLEPDMMAKLLARNISYPYYNGIYLPMIFGGVTAKNGLLLSARTFKMRFNLRTDVEQPIEMWEKEFIDRMKLLKTNKTEVSFEQYDSLNIELNTSVMRDVTMFAVTVGLMSIYACLVTAKGDCLSDRSLLGMAGVVSTMLGMLGGFGLCSACGVTFVSLVGVSPFLIIGIGLDNTFILLSGMGDALSRHDAVEERVAFMMRTSGLGITITSLTDLLAFLIGASSSLPAVQYFCIYTGITIFFTYINYMTFFVGCLVIDQKRIASNRHSKTFRKMASKEQLQIEGKGEMEIFCCTGKVPHTREDVDSPLESYPRNFLVSLTLTDALKPFVLLVYLFYLGISIWGCLNFNENLRLEQLVADDSYFHKFNVWKTEYYLTEIPITLVIDGEVDYSLPEVRQNIAHVINKTKALHDVDSQFQLSWLQAYSSSPYYNPINPQTFVTDLNLFLANDHSRLYENDIVFGADTSSIAYSRFYVRSRHLQDTGDWVNLIKDLREICDDSTLPVFAHNAWFVYGEQYISILPQTTQTLGAAAASILFVVLVFMPHPFIVITVMFAVASIIIGLIGFMYFWDLTLSSITMIQIIMSVGFSVDYTAHICHAFMSTKGATRSDRVRDALRHVGGPVFSGAISSILGVVVLAFSQAYIFRTFFKVMTLVILIGGTHALVILPVILSLVGPSNSHISRDKQKSSNSSSFTGDDFRIPRPLFEVINIFFVPDKPEGKK
ncbi:hypothetical protein ScPMuIL_011369 [Solemya velum]